MSSSSINSSQQNQKNGNNNQGNTSNDDEEDNNSNNKDREVGPNDPPPLPYVQPGEEVLQLADIMKEGDDGDNDDDNEEDNEADAGRKADIVQGNTSSGTDMKTSEDLSQKASNLDANEKGSKNDVHDTKSKKDEDGLQNRQQHQILSPQRRFPEKLHQLLDEASDHPEHSRIVSWMGHRAFKVHQPKVFASTILPHYFATSTYKSFQRNLNLWGFTCIAKGPRRGVCFHPFFVRGNEDDLSSHMKRSGDPSQILKRRNQQELLSFMSGSGTSATLGQGHRQHQTVGSPSRTFQPPGPFRPVSVITGASGNVSNTSSIHAPFMTSPGTLSKKKKKKQERNVEEVSDLGSNTASAASDELAATAPPKKKRKTKSKYKKLEALSPAVAGKYTTKNIDVKDQQQEGNIQLIQKLLRQQQDQRKMQSPVSTSTNPLASGVMSSLLQGGNFNGGNPSSNIQNTINTLTQNQQFQQKQQQQELTLQGGVNIQQLLAMVNRDSDMNRRIDIIQQLLAMENRNNQSSISNLTPTGNLERLLAMASTGTSDSNIANASNTTGNIATSSLQQLLGLTNSNNATKNILDSSSQNSKASEIAGAATSSPPTSQLIQFLQQQQHQQAEKKQQLQLLQQLQAGNSSSGMNDSSIASLLAAFQGRSSWQQQISELQQQESSQQNQIQGLLQQLAQQQQIQSQFSQQELTLQQAMQLVQQQQQNELLKIRQQTLHQQASPATQQPSVQQLLQLLKGGGGSNATASTAPLQLPQAAVRPAASAPDAQAQALQQLTQLWQSQRQSVPAQQLPHNDTGPQTQPLQKLVQSLAPGVQGSIQSPSSSSLFSQTSNANSILAAALSSQQQQQQGTTQQELLQQLLQAQQKKVNK